LNEENSTASVDIEFSDNCDLDDIFPILVGLNSPKTFFNFKVLKVL